MSGLSLLAPLGLVALVAVPLVILMHMRHTTPPVRPVPTLRFWLAAKPERTEQTRLRRPPLSLLLLLQLLIVTAIGLGLARPSTTEALDAFGLGLNPRTEPQHLIVLLDGSTSMAAVDTPSGRSRFNEARVRALDLLDGVREGDVATVLVLGTRTFSLQGTDAAGFASLRDRVRDLDPPGGRADLDAALALSHDLLLPDLADRVVILSDGALAADPETVANLGASIELRTIGDPASANVAVTEFAAQGSVSTPDLLQAFARIQSFANQPIVAEAILIADGLEVDRKPLDLAPGAIEEFQWPVPPGTSELAVRVEPGDAFAADNLATLLLRQEEEGTLGLRVLHVADAPSPLQRLLQALPGANVTPQTSDAPIPANESFDLIVFEKALPPADAEPLSAPALFINPPAGGPFAVDGAMVEPTVSVVRAQDPLLTGVDLAGVTFGETPTYVLDGTQTEIVGAAEGPLIFRTQFNGQTAIVMAFDLATSNLPRRVAFPILIQNVVTELAPSPLPPAVPLGDPLVYRPRAEAMAVRVAPPSGEAIDFPLAVETDEAATGSGGPASSERLREVAFADTGRPGIYAVTELDAEGGELGGGRFVVNAGHPRESDLRANPDLSAALATEQVADASSEGTTLADLWPLLVLAALALLAIEWLVALIPRRSMSFRLATSGAQAAAGRRGGRTR